MKELIQSIVEETISSLPDQTLPCPDEISYYVLEKERKIFLEFDVDPNIMAIYRMIMRWNIEDSGVEVEKRRPIKLYIMSYGGNIDYMWALLDAIRLSRTPVHTINVGVAASAAALLFMSGHVRFMLPNAKVMIHEGSAQFAGDANKVMDASDSYKKELARMKEFILAATKIPKAQLNKKRNNDWELDAGHCLEYGVCDHIVQNMDEVL